jgi:glycosyltransferase involved in cell wall biosynthesis
MLTNAPSITCICLTGRREYFLKRAIQCYLSQTYLNKTLLVVYPSNDLSTKKLVGSYEERGVTGLQLDPSVKMSLGAVRNHAIANCESDYFCQWDDDDWSHSRRLETQMQTQQAYYKTASILGHWLLFDSRTNEAYMSYYGAWAGSILCKRDIFLGGIRYPDLDRKEDSEFMKGLFKINCLIPVMAPVMYTYVYHGKNTWNAGHFEHFFKYSKKLSSNAGKLMTDILNGAISDEEGSCLLLEENIQKELDYFHYPEPEEAKRAAPRTLPEYLTRYFKR